MSPEKDDFLSSASSVFMGPERIEATGKLFHGFDSEFSGNTGVYKHIFVKLLSNSENHKMK